MTDRLRQRYIVFAALALFWASGNAVYVYLVLGGERMFRLESAAFILVGVLLPLMFWGSFPVVTETALTQVDNRLLMVVAGSLWLLTLIPFLNLPFLSDDYVFLATYRRWSDVLSVNQFFRPAFAVAFMLLAKIGNGSTAPFHAVAGVIHGASAACVYVLSRRLFGRTDAATFCAAMFLLNPLQLEAVLWVSGLQELLWSFFVLLALVVYSGARVLSFRRLIAAVALVALALLSKETAISSVLLLPAADWMLFRMRRGRLLTAAYVGVGIVTVGYLVARSEAAGIETGYFLTPGKYFAQKFIGTPYKFFAQPWNLTAVYIPAFVLCLATVTAFAVLFWAVVRGIGATVLVGPAVILVSTLPVYGYFYVAPDLRATRYLYFAAIGWALLVTQLLTTAFGQPRTLRVVFGGVILMMFVSLQANVKPWRTVGQIVRNIESAIREGKSPERDTADWKAKYGDGLEVKDGVPTVYKGIYIFVNGYTEFRTMITSSRPQNRPFSQTPF